MVLETMPEVAPQSTPPERRRRPPLQRARSTQRTSAQATRTQRTPNAHQRACSACNGAQRRPSPETAPEGAPVARLKRASSALEMRLNRSPKPHLQQGYLIRASMASEGAGMVRL